MRYDEISSSLGAEAMTERVYAVAWKDQYGNIFRMRGITWSVLKKTYKWIQNQPGYKLL